MNILLKCSNANKELLINRLLNSIISNYPDFIIIDKLIVSLHDAFLTPINLFDVNNANYITKSFYFIVSLRYSNTSL